MNLTHKILSEHLVSGRLVRGEEIGLKIDHVLMQDATGTMAMLEFEALRISRIRAQAGFVFVDHNVNQIDEKNADDHLFLQSAALRFGFHFSPAGNGICHQVYLERFGFPGGVVLGSDSHTPSAAGVSALGIGAGGLDVALAAAGYPYYLPCPEVLGVRLVGRLPSWVSARDIVLEMLRRYGVKGCVGQIIEYYGPGVATLSVTDRLTIANKGAELGATGTVFPSDRQTLAFLTAQDRTKVFRSLVADDDAAYDFEDEINLGDLEPLIACPSSPGNVVPVRQVAGVKVDQVIIGSCANSSYRDLIVAAEMVQGRQVHPRVSMHINPGSRQVLLNVIRQGGLSDLISAGARVHIPACHGCIGIGQAPGTGRVSLRTFTRNFSGRSGTKDDRVYLCSPETAAAAALTGEITDPRDLNLDYPRVTEPSRYITHESSVIKPQAESHDQEIIRAPHIRPFPDLDALPEDLMAEIGLVVEDNITTDHIMPAGAAILPFRSNIEASSRFVYQRVFPGFAELCRSKGRVAVVGGENYGQGSSREHAALAPRYLGVRIKLVKSFARIHKANLCNFGILPLTFRDPADYAKLTVGAQVILPGIRTRIEKGDQDIPMQVGKETIWCRLEVSDRQRQALLAGGTLNYVRQVLKEAT